MVESDTPSSRPNQAIWLDQLNRFGAAASFLCAIHCLAMPLLIGVLPLIGLGLLTTPWLEWSLIGLAGLMGIVTLPPSYCRDHRQLQPLGLFTLGFGLILVTKLFITEGSALETLGMVIGALFVAGANLVNHRLVHARTVCRH